MRCRVTKPRLGYRPCAEQWRPACFRHRRYFFRHTKPFLFVNTLSVISKSPSLFPPFPVRRDQQLPWQISHKNSENDDSLPWREIKFNWNCTPIFLSEICLWRFSRPEVICERCFTPLPPPSPPPPPPRHPSTSRTQKRFLLCEGYTA